jgi:hypothetical protein
LEYDFAFDVRQFGQKEVGNICHLWSRVRHSPIRVSSQNGFAVRGLLSGYIPVVTLCGSSRMHNKTSCCGAHNGGDGKQLCVINGGFLDLPIGPTRRGKRERDKSKITLVTDI